MSLCDPILCLKAEPVFEITPEFYVVGALARNSFSSNSNAFKKITSAPVCRFSSKIKSAQVAKPPEFAHGAALLVSGRPNVDML
jgi:hypothetical protein